MPNVVTPLHVGEGSKVKFVELGDGRALINLAAIALIVTAPSGDAQIVTVNGSAINVEALLWQMCKKDLMEVVEIVKLHGSSGLVAPGGRSVS